MFIFHVPAALISAIVGGLRKILTGKLGSETQLIGFVAVLIALLQSVCHANGSWLNAVALFCALMFTHAVSILGALVYITDDANEVNPNHVLESAHALPTMMLCSLLIATIVGGAILFVLSSVCNFVDRMDLCVFTFILSGGYGYIAHYLIVKRAEVDDID